jgi:hypothetical protein
MQLVVFYSWEGKMAQTGFKILLISILFINVTGVNSISKEIGISKLPFEQIKPDNQNDSIIIGGFDFARGGDGGSFQYGAYFSHARDSIAANLPNPVFISFPTLTSASLTGVDILILTSTYTNGIAVSPLTNNEQTALLNFIRTGGCAILMTDNNSFGGIPESGNINQSIIGPFDVTTAGALGENISSIILNPLNSLITSGPYGTISGFSQNWPGYFVSDGIYANRLANNDSGGALDVINADAIQAGSGPVIIYSDTNTFFNEDFHGFYYANENLFMNSIHFCYMGSSTDLYKISGRVTDGGGNGIPNVQVSTLKSGRTTTDAQGYYTISALPAGSYTLAAKSIYYEFDPEQTIVNLPPDSVDQNFIGKRLEVIFIPKINN